MNTFAVRLSAVFLTALLFCSCAAHQVPFNEADFVRPASAGTGTVNGKVFRTDRSDEIWIQTHGSTVRLIPANAYTEEIAQRKYTNREWLAKPDPRMRKYVLRTKTAPDGSFAFHGVPAGNYLVSCHFKWSYPTDGTDADGNYEEVQASDDQWLFDHVTVVRGNTTTITGWDQGR